MLRFDKCDMQEYNEEATDSKEKAFVDNNNVFGDIWYRRWFVD